LYKHISPNNVVKVNGQSIYSGLQKKQSNVFQSSVPEHSLWHHSLVVFFDWKGIVHHEFVPRGQMVNKQLYWEVLACLRDAVCRKRPELWENQTWMLHHDNAQAHKSFLIRSYVAKHQTFVVPHTPYSPDLAPADFFLFPKLKTTLKGRCFQTIVEIQENVITELRTITQSVF